MFQLLVLNTALRVEKSICLVAKTVMRGFLQTLEHKTSLNIPAKEFASADFLFDDKDSGI